MGMPRIEADFSFEEWLFLAAIDPVAFEQRRKWTVERFLMDSSGRQRVLGLALQREIDAERSRARDPQEAFQIIARMMCKQAAFLGEGILDLSKDFARARACLS